MSYRPEDSCPGFLLCSGNHESGSLSAGFNLELLMPIASREFGETLPVVRNNATNKRTESTCLTNMSRARVLVIDDDPLFRSLLTSMLRKDYLVAVACDGAEGYYKALEHPPLLAIVDIQMPGWDGLKTLKAFRSHHLLSHVPVMMLTSDSSRQTVMAAIQGGAKDYVIKTTLSREDFLQKVARQLESSSGIEDSDLHEPGGDCSDCRNPGLTAEAHGASSAHDTDVAVSDGPGDDSHEDAMLQQILDNWD
jgi:CheY-like chemotaxis protein